MTNEQRWLCEYCGDCWVEQLILWQSSPQRCLKCGETQLLKKLKGKQTGDVFGYEPPKKHEVSHEFED